MPRAIVDVHVGLIAEMIFGRAVRVIKAIDQPNESFIRLVIEGTDLPAPENGLMKKVIATVTRTVEFTLARQLEHNGQ